MEVGRGRVAGVRRWLAAAAVLAFGWGCAAEPVRGRGGDPPGNAAAGAAEELLLPVPGGGLSGTLLVPQRPGRPPVVLLIAGSGPTDRDGNSPILPGKNNSLRQLAEALAERGYASLRYDKRGVGRSAWPGLREEQLRFEDTVSDAAGWIRLLAADPRFGGVAVLGHSEGALVGLVALRQIAAGRQAAADQAVPARALVLVAAPGRTFQDTLRRQLAGQPEARRRRIEAILRRLERGERVEDVPPDLQELFRPSVQPYLISLFRYDPREEIRKVPVPVLIVQGGRDLQVGVEDARRLQAARPQARLAIIPDMNHVLKTVGESRESNLQAYSDPAVPLSLPLVETVTRFLAVQFRVPR